MTRSGLSPRVRGNRLPAPSPNPNRRSIPACAGEPARGGGAGCSSAVYPRVCGGTQTTGVRRTRKRGLSPRVRGNPVMVVLRNATGRSIPACAGEPRPRAFGCRICEVYPRVCGGTPPALPPVAVQQGLSPRVRGNRYDGFRHHHTRGSIPACAGEPGGLYLAELAEEVYPRVCGGTARRRARVAADGGLSPRVRGNLLRQFWGNLLAGSIPACAGEPISGLSRNTAARVYPRVCGGTGGSPKSALKGGGLSPRVRGNRFDRFGKRQDDGSIPACAGEPFKRRRAMAQVKVYPRVCGGTHGSQSFP